MTKYEILVKFTGKNKYGIWELENIFKCQHTTLDRALEGRDLFYEVETHENQEVDGYVMVEYKEGKRVNMAKCYVKVRLEDSSYQLDYEKGWE